MSSNLSSGNDRLMNGSGGTPWCKFPTVGTVVTGQVVSEPVEQQQRDYDDQNKLLTWDNGDPRMEVVVHLQTDDRRDDVEGDTGLRALHMSSPNMLNAVRAAVRSAQRPGLEVGGTLTITYTGDGELKPGRRGQPPKLYSASYTGPTSSGNGALMGGATAAQPAGPPRPEQIDPAKWAAMDIDQQRSVAAALGAAAGAASPGY